MYENGVYSTPDENSYLNGDTAFNAHQSSNWFIYGSVSYELYPEFALSNNSEFASDKNIKWGIFAALYYHLSSSLCTGGVPMSMKIYLFVAFELIA